jgi:hypothetical protein
MKPQTMKRILFIGIGLLVFMLVVVGLVILFIVFVPAVSTPIITIHSPALGDRFEVGELVVVDSTSSDENYKIDKVELWEIEGERMRLVSVETPLEPDSSFSVPQSWLAPAVGTFRLSVRAFNDRGGYGQAAVDIEVVESLEGKTEIALAEGEMLPPYGEITDDTEAINGTPPQPNPNPPQSDLWDFFADNIIRNFSDFFIPEYPIITRVKIEALEFEVFNDYEGVVCYASLNDSPNERIPESGFFETTSQFH